MNVVSPISERTKPNSKKWCTTSTAIEIVDIFLLPNFCKFIKPFIDTSFGRTHKEEYTQHQWRFKAVRPDRTYFPRGVKVTYKKYSSDKLVIIEKKPAQLCRRIEGQMTGLESTTINS